jgi:hypothetical protein
MRKFGLFCRRVRTYSLLLDLHLVLSSIKTSLEVIVGNEKKKRNQQKIMISQSSCHCFDQYQMYKISLPVNFIDNIQIEIDCNWFGYERFIFFLLNKI